MQNKSSNKKIGAIANLVMAIIIFALGAFTLKTDFDLRAHHYHYTNFPLELLLPITFMVTGILQLIDRIIWLRKNKHLPL